MFPKKLDGATVLYYTPEDQYGQICYTTGQIADTIHYLAICKYKNDSVYYLFGCNKDYEVISDSPWNSAEECMRIANSSYERSISWIEMV